MAELRKQSAKSFATQQSLEKRTSNIAVPTWPFYRGFHSYAQGPDELFQSSMMFRKHQICLSQLLHPNQLGKPANPFIYTRSSASCITGLMSPSSATAFCAYGKSS